MTSPSYQSFENVVGFRDAIVQELSRDLMPNHLLLSLVDQRDDKAAEGEELAFAVVRCGDEVAGAVVQTLPGRAVFSSMNPEVARFAYREWVREHGVPKAINGPESTMAALLEDLTQRHPSRPPQAKRLLTYELTEVIMPANPCEGSMRFAEGADEELLVDWGVRFAIDCGLFEARSPTLRDEERIRVRRVLEGRKRVIWEVDGVPVSMAGITRVSRFGSTIAAVYTPEAHRGKGYASRLVAELSEHLLKSGTPRCMLFTDAGNPVSNAIYQRVGYRRAVDFFFIENLPAE